MNMDNYDAMLSDIDCIKELLFAMSKHIDVIENTVSLILMAVGAKESEHKEEKIPMKKLVDVLPNDRLLDEFEHTEGTYKDYSKITNDSLTETELKSFEAGQRGEIYTPEQSLTSAFAEAVEKSVARKKGLLATASERWPTDEELDAQEEAELAAYKKHLKAVEKSVAKRKGLWVAASERWPTDEELDAQEEAELTTYKKHLEDDKEYSNCEVL